MTAGGSSRRSRVKPGGSLENSQSSHPAEITSETRSVWWCLPSQLQGVQAFLPTQRMLHSHFVCHLRGRDVNLGVLGGALPCQRHRTSTLRFVLKIHSTYNSCAALHVVFWVFSVLWSSALIKQCPPTAGNTISASFTTVLHGWKKKYQSFNRLAAKCTACHRKICYTGCVDQIIKDESWITVLPPLFTCSFRFLQWVLRCSENSPATEISPFPEWRSATSPWSPAAAWLKHPDHMAGSVAAVWSGWTHFLPKVRSTETPSLVETSCRGEWSGGFKRTVSHGWSHLLRGGLVTSGSF